MKELIAELVPTYHIKEEDRERERQKIDEKYHEYYEEEPEGLDGAQ